MFFWVIIGLVLLLSLVLIVMVLLQPSKGGGTLGAAFGGLGTQLGSTFGSRRTLDFLAKGTTYVAAAIAALCLIANLLFVPTGSAGTVAPVTTGARPTTPAAPAPMVPGGQAPGQSAPAPQGQPQQAQPQQGQPQQPAAPTTPAPAN